MIFGFAGWQAVIIIVALMFTIVAGLYGVIYGTAAIIREIRAEDDKKG